MKYEKAIFLCSNGARSNEQLFHLLFSPSTSPTEPVPLLRAITVGTSTPNAITALSLLSSGLPIPGSLSFVQAASWVNGGDIEIGEE